MCHKLYKYGFAIFIMCFILLNGCGKTKPTIELHPVSFSALPNWNQDHFVEVWPAFLRSCQKKRSSSPACLAASTLEQPSDAQIKAFFENYFQAYKVTSGHTSKGLFTGYYEPTLPGSRTKTEQFKIPLYKRPNDLVMIEDLGAFRKELRGIRIAGRVVNGRLKPYYTHAQIDQGVLQGNELIWIEDPIDAFFVQIQGSAAIQLNDNELVHIGYAGTNGHPYTAIGNVLIHQNMLTTNNVSMQTIRAWLKEHEDQAKQVLYQNASFVFFDEMKGDGPVGDHGVVLTPGRSIAVDHVYVPHDTLIWLDVEHPLTKSRIQRLVVAQDSGGAIKGPIRGDLYWGTGDEAGMLAGSMKSKGSYYFLLPRKHV